MKQTPLFCGIDIGSLSAECVIVDENDVLAYTIIKTGSGSVETAQNVLQLTLEKLENSSSVDIAYTVATGYGRVLVPFAQENVTELSCHAKGANVLFPDCRTILDIGGQDCKVICCDENGNITDFVMNDKCAAGTGRFLEMAARTLGLQLDEIGPLSLQARNTQLVNSRCVVFAKTEILGLNRTGVDKADILAGTHAAIAQRIYELYTRVNFKEKLVFTGGGAKNLGLVKAIEERLDVGKILVPPEPQIVGALGAAVIARDKWKKSNK